MRPMAREFTRDGDRIVPAPEYSAPAARGGRALTDWQAEVGAWHEVAFPWAKASHILDKLKEETSEAMLAWAGVRGDLPDELADCLICVLAAMAREGISADAALAAKFPRVQAKYDAPQPAPRMPRK